MAKRKPWDFVEVLVCCEFREKLRIRMEGIGKFCRNQSPLSKRLRNEMEIWENLYLRLRVAEFSQSNLVLLKKEPILLNFG